MLKMSLILLMFAHDSSDFGVENAQKIASFHNMETCESAANAINEMVDTEYAYCAYY